MENPILDDVSNQNLKPYIILYTTNDFNVPEPSLFHAEDTEHAEEQMESECPGCNIIWVVETDSADEAFEVYHRESTMCD
jgi:hypothetical protein